MTKQRLITHENLVSDGFSVDKHNPQLLSKFNGNGRRVSVWVHPDRVHWLLAVSDKEYFDSWQEADSSTFHQLRTMAQVNHIANAYLNY